MLYDLSSSYFEGVCCPLARRGYSRDGKKGKLQVNYGLLTDARGCPMSISVFEGNTSDRRRSYRRSKAAQDFGLGSVILVGDRGMISNTAIEAMREEQGLEWITALKNVSIRKLAETGDLQFGLFDERNLLEIRSAQDTRMSGWWRAAIRRWRGCARTSANHCSRPHKET